MDKTNASMLNAIKNSLSKASLLDRFGLSVPIFAFHRVFQRYADLGLWNQHIKAHFAYSKKWKIAI